MKNILIIIVLCLGNLAYAQIPTTNDNKFHVVSPLKRSTYNGVKIKNIKYRDLKKTLLSKNDPQITHNIQAISTKSAVSTTLVCIGAAVMVAAFVKSVSDISQNNSRPPVRSNPSRTTYNDGSEASSIMVVGALIEVIGSCVNIGNKSLLRKSMLRYNEVNPTAPKTNLSLNIQPVNNRAGVGITLTHKF